MQVNSKTRLLSDFHGPIYYFLVRSTATVHTLLLRRLRSLWLMPKADLNIRAQYLPGLFSIYEKISFPSGKPQFVKILTCVQFVLTVFNFFNSYNLWSMVQYFTANIGKKVFSASIRLFTDKQPLLKGSFLPVDKVFCHTSRDYSVWRLFKQRIEHRRSRHASACA